MISSKVIIIIVVITVMIAFLAWLFIESTKPPPPLPGTKIDDLGRSHVSSIFGVAYNSNPPTSGPHFPVWAKRGVYERVLSDGHLIHSLEHGYIILSYNCDKKVYAHEGKELISATSSASESEAPLHVMKVGLSGEMSAFTPRNPPEAEIPLSEEFNSDSCKDLRNQLSSFLNNYQRIIIVPRPGLDTRIVLTAWTRLDKMDKFDSERIKTFIDAFHNKGPERTVE